MGKPIDFEVKVNLTRGGEVESHTVHEKKTDRQVALYDSRPHDAAKAEAHAAYLRNEHKDGRVAQGTCDHSAKCDRDRIHVSLREFKARPEAKAVVLCEHHRAALDAA